MLITISRNSSKQERIFARSLSNLFSAQYISRGNHNLFSLDSLAQSRAHETILIISKNHLSFFQDKDYKSIFSYFLLENSPIREKFQTIKDKSKDKSFSKFFSFQSDAELSLEKQKDIFFFKHNNLVLPLKFKVKKCLIK